MTEDTGSGKIILLVDDDEIQLASAESSLKGEYKIFKVESGEKALEFLSRSQIIP